ncbi:hypothetical protein ES703_86660 [subsurface metagenome]
MIPFPRDFDPFPQHIYPERCRVASYSLLRIDISNQFPKRFPFIIFFKRSAFVFHKWYGRFGSRHDAIGFFNGHEGQIRELNNKIFEGFIQEVETVLIASTFSLRSTNPSSPLQVFPTAIMQPFQELRHMF